MHRTLALAALFVGATFLGGCHLYFGSDDDDDSYTYCDDTGCYYCDDWGCYPSGEGGGPGGPGWDCDDNYDCAAGCYCSNAGQCEEAGFCTDDNDCPAGFECDDRSSCVPEGSGGACTGDDQCPSGSYCDEAAGYCVGSWTCDPDSATADDECGQGFVCNDSGTCVPQPCTDDYECEVGCYCDEEIGECIETQPCGIGGSCPGDLVCDEDRNTCEPPPPLPPITCQGEVTCDLDEPTCASGYTAEIEDGCYTGQCMLKADCPDGAPFECSDLDGDEQGCFDHEACYPVYTGQNCTNNMGELCSSGEANCTCETFEYDYCGVL